MIESFKNPQTSRGIRFLDLSWLSPNDDGNCDCRLEPIIHAAATCL